MRTLALAMTALLLMAACGSELTVDTYPTTPGTSTACKTLMGASPQKVSGQGRVVVEGGNASAWGDPAIILRCGVEKPAGLTAAAQCYPVSGVNWFPTKTDDGYVFTTIGRRFYVSVEVPQDYRPEADALSDVAAMVAKHDAFVKDCV